MVDIYIPGSSMTGAHAINDTGQVVGPLGIGGASVVNKAFLWDSVNGMIYLDGKSDSYATCINAIGQVVGKVSVDRGRASLWDISNGMVILGTLGGHSSSARAINDPGQVVGGSFVTDPVAYHAFLWDTTNGMIDLGTLGEEGVAGAGSWANAINNAGQVVGTSQKVNGGAMYPFIWDSVSGIAELGTPGAWTGEATAINDYGQVVGSLDIIGRPSHAFIWDSTNGIIDLNLYLPPNSEWEHPLRATGINNRGQIVGYGSVGEETHAFLFLPTVYIYVDADATGANNGSSWEDAFVNLQDALLVDSLGPEIRVAQGTYKPDQGGGNTSGDREATFQLKNNVSIKGGYAGFGEPDPNARDIEAYKTILSGDLYGDDSQVFAPGELLNDPNRAENSYHVVTGSGTNSTAVLDGFTITGGNANGTKPDHRGGGMFNELDSSPTVTNCTFIANSATFRGGGMYNGDYSTPMVNNCTFTGNLAGRGGGMCNDEESTTTVINCIFSGNSASYGGGMGNDEGSPILVNCTFVGNSANNGGGMETNERGNAMITNCIFWANSPNQISLDYEGGASASVTYTDIQGGWDGMGNIDVDPLFVDPCDGDFHLKSEGWRWDKYMVHGSYWKGDFVTSRCIDAGNPGSPLGDELLTISDDPYHNWGENLRINMGAYGGTTQASMPPHGWALFGDLSNDGIIDYVDLAGQVEDWLTIASQQPGDLNRDGVVNGTDFALLAQDWLKMTDWAQ